MHDFIHLSDSLFKVRAFYCQRSSFTRCLSNIMSFIKDNYAICKHLLRNRGMISIEKIVVRHQEKSINLFSVEGIKIRTKLLFLTSLSHSRNIEKSIRKFLFRYCHNFFTLFMILTSRLKWRSFNISTPTFSFFFYLFCKFYTLNTSLNFLFSF